MYFKNATGRRGRARQKCHFFIYIKKFCYFSFKESALKVRFRAELRADAK